MLNIKNVLKIDGTRCDFAFDKLVNFDKNMEDVVIDGSDLLVLPGMIDPHVHFRVPGLEDKEDWIHASKAALKGGITTVFDMPNTNPPTTTEQRLVDKFSIIDNQLNLAKIPLRYELFFGADKNNFHQIIKVKNNIVGIKVFMGSSTGDLLMDDESSLHAIYALAKIHNLVVALHAEDEMIIQNNALIYKNETDFKYHSIIRDKTAAVKAVRLVIELSRIYDVSSYILHVSTREEIELISRAKSEGLKIYAETCCHYLFLDDSCYSTLHGKAKMNPPLRSKEDQTSLWQALNAGIIDTVASDHAPHTLAQKDQPLCRCPSGVPGVETTLPLLLTAYKDSRISLQTIVKLLHTNPMQIFGIPSNNDLVFVDINNYHKLDESKLATKVKWSPFANMNLTGYPKFVFMHDILFDVTRL